MAGWVKLHRRTDDSDMGGNFILQGIWTTLIRKANWSETTVNWRGSPRRLKRGELMTSVARLAERGGVDRKTVAKWLNYLEKRKSIEIEKAPKGSCCGVIIKIVNYDKYQELDAEWSHEDGHEPGDDDPKSMDTLKEYKNKRINNTQPKKTKNRRNWVNEASRVLAAIQRYGTGTRDTEDLHHELADLMPIVARIPGGFSQIRNMPRNDFTVRNLATMLSASAQSQEAS